MLCLCSTLTEAVFVYLCVCVFVYLVNEAVVVGEWILDSGGHTIISFQKIYIVEIRGHQAGQTNDDKQTREDRATQPLSCRKAEFRN